MENLKQLPTLGFGQAVRLASHRLLEFKGRSRRSEYWWWMLCVFIVSQIASMFVPSLNASLILSCIIMAFALAVTVRRVQDGGHSGWWVWLSYASGIVYQALFFGTFGEIFNKAMNGASQKALQKAAEKMIEGNSVVFAIAGVAALVWMVTCVVLFVFCLMDGKPEANKYGESPKYITE